MSPCIVLFVTVSMAMGATFSPLVHTWALLTHAWVMYELTRAHAQRTRVFTCRHVCSCAHMPACMHTSTHTRSFPPRPFVSPFHSRAGSTRLCLLLTGCCFLPAFQTENRAVSCCWVFPRFCRDMKVGIPGEMTCPIPIPIPRPCLLLTGCWHQPWGLSTGPSMWQEMDIWPLRLLLEEERRGAGMELGVPLNSPEGVKAG